MNVEDLIHNTKQDISQHLLKQPGCTGNCKESSNSLEMNGTYGFKCVKTPSPPPPRVLASMCSLVGGTMVQAAARHIWSYVLDFAQLNQNPSVLHLGPSLEV